MRFLFPLLLLPSLAWGVVATAPQGGRGAMPFCVNISDEATPLACTKELNFTGAGVTCTAVPLSKRVDCTIGGGGAVGYDTVQDEGVGLTQRTTLNFAGAGVTCADDGGVKTTCTISGGGGSTILDLGDDGVNESTSLAEIAVTGDTTSIFTEPSPDKLLINVGQPWNSALLLAVNPSDCVGGQYATTIAQDGDLTCAQVNFNQLAGTATDAQIPDTITINLAGTATALAADPTDCGANNYATTIAANGNLTCAQVNFNQLAGTATDAQIPDTITLTNITQIGTRSHASLQNLGADDHTQYLLLAGRAAGQTAIGGTAAGDDLTLQSTSNASKGSIILGDTISSASQDVVSWSPSGNLGANTLHVMNIAPTLGLNNASGLFRPIHWGGTYTATVAQPTVDFSFMLHDYTTTSSTNGIAPWYEDAWVQGWTANLDGAGVTATGTNPLTILYGPNTNALNGANFTTGFYTVIYGGGNFNATGASNSVLTVPMRSLVRDIGILTTTNNGGSVTVTDVNTVYTVDSTKPANTTHLASIMSDMASGTGKYHLYLPGTAQSVIGGAVRIGDTTNPTEKLEVKGLIKQIGSNISGLASKTAGYDAVTNFTMSGTVDTWAAVRASGTITDTTANVVNLFANELTYDRTTGAANITAGVTINDIPTIRANGIAITGGTNVGLTHNPTFTTTGGGTLSGVSDNAVRAQITVSAGTVANRRGLLFEDGTGAGAITTQVALDVQSLSKGTTNIGVRNASTTVNTPSTVQTIGAGGAIACNATVVQIQSTGDVTTSTSTAIADGQDGQICTIVGVDNTTTDTVTLDCAGANVRCNGGTDYPIETGDTITLMYIADADVADWVELSHSNN